MIGAVVEATVEVIAAATVGVIGAEAKDFEVGRKAADSPGVAFVVARLAEDFRAVASEAAVPVVQADFRQPTCSDGLIRTAMA